MINSQKITLAPESIVEEILQNVSMIISTPQYSVPLNRAFGLPYKFLDKPIQVAKAMFVSEIADAVELFEPRAKVIAVIFVQSEEEGVAGKLIPKVEVKILE